MPICGNLGVAGRGKFMKRQVTFLKEEQLAALKRISAKSGAPISTLIRMAVAEYVERHAAK